MDPGPPRSRRRRRAGGGSSGDGDLIQHLGGDLEQGGGPVPLHHAHGAHLGNRGVIAGDHRQHPHPLDGREVEADHRDRVPAGQFGGGVDHRLDDGPGRAGHLAS